MAWSTEWNDLLTTTVTVYAWANSFDGYGEPTYSSVGTSYNARIRESPKVIETSDNQTITSEVQLIVASTVSLAATSKYILADGTYPAVRKVERVYDEDGLHHHILYLGGA